jgi:hypothetical protein
VTFEDSYYSIVCPVGQMWVWPEMYLPGAFQASRQSRGRLHDSYSYLSLSVQHNIACLLALVATHCRLCILEVSYRRFRDACFMVAVEWSVPGNVGHQQHNCTPATPGIWASRINFGLLFAYCVCLLCICVIWYCLVECWLIWCCFSYVLENE